MLFVIEVFEVALVLELWRHPRALHELIKVLRNFPLEGVSDQFVVLVNNFNGLAVQVSEEVQDRRCQYLVLDAR